MNRYRPGHAVELLRSGGEYFPALASWDVTFLATDLSTEVLARARAGLFTQLEVNRGLPAALLLKHFTKVGSDWQVKDDLRRMIDFRVLILLDGRPNLVGIDLVFLRNVLIYFDTPTKKDILGRIRRWLRPDGCLFLGGAETTWGLDEGYDRVTQGKTTY